MTDPETPAARLIRICGVERLARWTGVSTTQVYRWDYPRTKGGSGGVIPAFHHQAILDGARADKLKVKVADFFAAGGKAA